ncbi:MAG: hypothetical protein R3C15_07525 [Thermoleophilia bacterium]
MRWQPVKLELDSDGVKIDYPVSWEVGDVGEFAFLSCRSCEASWPNADELRKEQVTGVPYAHTELTPSGAIGAIHQILWPRDDPGKDWSADTLDEIAHVLVGIGYGPPQSGDPPS